MGMRRWAGGLALRGVAVVFALPEPVGRRAGDDARRIRRSRRFRRSGQLPRYLSLRRRRAVGDDSRRPRAENRYLILAIKEGPRGSVQCLFVENDARLLCEAESGFYAQKAGEPR